MVTGPARGAGDELTGSNARSEKKEKKKKGELPIEGENIFLPSPPADDYSLKVAAVGFKQYEKTVPIHESKIENIVIKLSAEEPVMGRMMIRPTPKSSKLKAP